MKSGERTLLVDQLVNMADELDAQAVALHGAIHLGTREEWEAYEHITRASAYMRAAARALDERESHSVN
jgi:hypothetical protein